MAEGEEELKSLSMKVKEESEKVGLKLNIQKMKIMAPSCIVSWQIEGGEGGEKEKVTVLFSWPPKTLRTVFLGRKAMTNQDSVLGSRDITLLTMDHIVKAMIFPLVMFRYESWTIKKAECQRIDAFEP